MANISNHIYRLPPLGKPNPNEIKPEGADTRTRVIQPGSKDTSFHAVFNLMRERYRAPNTNAWPGRVFERLESERRKKLTQHKNETPDILGSLDLPKIKQILSQLTQEAVRNPAQRAQLIKYEQMKIEIGQVKKGFVSHLDSFLAQNRFSNLYGYFFDMKYTPRTAINLSFLQALGLDPQQEFRKICAQNREASFKSADWNDLSPEHQVILSDTIVRLATAERYGFKVSPWMPSQKIDSLIEELRIRGPLIFGGYFGEAYYEKPPIHLPQKIEGRDVYGWALDNPRIKTNTFGNMLLLIGAEKLGDKEYVYFLDAHDTSDPAYPEKQKIYKMSYKRFTDRQCLHDNQGFGHANHPDASPEVGYALYLS